MKIFIYTTNQNVPLKKFYQSFGSLKELLFFNDEKRFDEKTVKTLLEDIDSEDDTATFYIPSELKGKFQKLLERRFQETKWEETDLKNDLIKRCPKTLSHFINEMEIIGVLTSKNVKNEDGLQIADYLYEKALGYCQSNQLEPALALLKEVVQLAPNHANAEPLLADISAKVEVERKRHDEALKEARQLKSLYQKQLDNFHRQYQEQLDDCRQRKTEWESGCRQYKMELDDCRQYKEKLDEDHRKHKKELDDCRHKKVMESVFVATTLFATVFSIYLFVKTGINLIKLTDSELNILLYPIFLFPFSVIIIIIIIFYYHGFGVTSTLKRIALLAIAAAIVISVVLLIIL